MVEGVQGFQQFMTKRLPDAIRKAAQLSLEKSGSELVSALQAVAPYETGELRTTVRFALSNDYESVAITIIGGDDRTVEGSKQKARLQEFGTVNMPANPWFFPLYRRRRRAIQNKLSRDIKRAIKNAGGGS